VLHWTLIWWGDVLHVYALLGFLLILFRNKTDKKLLIIAAAFMFAPFIAALAGTTVQHFTDKTTVEEKAKKESERQQRRQKKVVEDVRVMSKGSLPEIIQYRVKMDLERLPGEIGWGTELFANFLLGLWVSRRRILQDPQLYRPLLTKLAYIALPLGLAFATADLVYGYQHPAQDSPLWRIHTGLIREFLARPAIGYGYAALLLLIGIKSWMSPIAAVGRMAMTNYLLHSLVFTTLVNSYGMGTYGRIHPLQGLIYCCAFYALQIPCSLLWLKYFNYGPAEWLWRSLTYGVRQPWMKAAA
jgi:uncharacterized protein